MGKNCWLHRCVYVPRSAGLLSCACSKGSVSSALRGQTCGAVFCSVLGASTLLFHGFLCVVSCISPANLPRRFQDWLQTVYGTSFQRRSRNPCTSRPGASDRHSRKEVGCAAGCRAFAFSPLFFSGLAAVRRSFDRPPADA